VSEDGISIRPTDPRQNYSCEPKCPRAGAFRAVCFELRLDERANRIRITILRGYRTRAAEGRKRRPEGDAQDPWNRGQVITPRSRTSASSCTLSCASTRVSASGRFPSGEGEPQFSFGRVAWLANRTATQRKEQEDPHGERCGTQDGERGRGKGRGTLYERGLGRESERPEGGKKEGEGEQAAGGREAEEDGKKDASSSSPKWMRYAPEIVRNARGVVGWLSSLTRESLTNVSRPPSPLFALPSYLPPPPACPLLYRSRKFFTAVASDVSLG